MQRKNRKERHLKRRALLGDLSLGVPCVLARNVFFVVYNGVKA
jgi:hypothetical protein